MNIKNKNPKISIIVPIYNTSLYLEQCLDSVLQQDFDDYEVICVNDGSTDNSLEILRKYEKISSKIKIVNKPNSGVAITRNVGLKNATGDYIAFLDSDDFIKENYLSTLYNRAIKDDSDIVICNFYKYYEDKNLAVPIVYKFRSGKFSKEAILKGLIPDNLIHSYLWNKLWKREIFEDLDVFPNMKYEDLAIMTALVYKAKRVSVIGNKLYYYRIRKTSIVRNINLNTQNDYIRAYGLIRLFLEKNNEYDNYKLQYTFFSMKAYIVMQAVNLMLLKKQSSLKLFMQNVLSINDFIKACNSSEFNLTEEDIMNFSVLSDRLRLGTLNLGIDSRNKK